MTEDHEVWHVPSAPTISHRQLAGIVFEEVGFPLRIRASKLSSFFVRMIDRF